MTASALVLLIVFTPGIVQNCPPAPPPAVELARGVRVIARRPPSDTPKPGEFPPGPSLDTPDAACLIPRPFRGELAP